MPRVALISATPAAIGPAVAGLAGQFPEAEPWNLLDDKLLADAENGLTPALADRMRRLIAHALAGHADGILLTCSLYGVVARETNAPVPVLAPDEAVFEEAREYRRILVLASFGSALRDCVSRFTTVSDSEVDGVVAADAFGATGSALSEALVEAARPHVGHADAVLLGQYSLAPAAAELADALGTTVLSGPNSAASKLRHLLLP
ncbi:aspartate/glutamate racemase family protein [Amycolatopsis sp. YIM 10]|uniref:aspartate/glutamate racemase family protein n=1 Tax=Amycolatopsis sp. YIM 10 TaxID=2653857 RepID=UPI00128FD18D|nr:aspartate/glutamate racemase family protein [Amycolatopsis sp. YIM 10]QFU88442.1 Asp/Glu/Hydantoin racemase [Amycolatopsis sp. YIM 10]